jgi:hypothetical protein
MNPPITPALASALTGTDEPVLLLVAAQADDASARAAIRLAGARAETGLATILADGGLTEPTLHGMLAADNLEGLADLFLFGASLAHVSAALPDRSFRFIPSGPYVPDPAAVLDNPRWDRIRAELRTSGAMMLVYVPAGTPGLGALSRRLGSAILISTEQGASRASARLDRHCNMVGRVEPDELPPLEPIPVAATEEVALSEPPVARAKPRARPRPLSLALLALVVLILALGGWFLYRTLAEGSPGTTRATPADTAAAPVARGAPVETPIPVSVAVEAHQDLITARERVAALSRAEPRIGFFLAPVPVSGVIFYRLLAGPVADAETGTALLQRLVDAGHKTAFDSWAVRPTQYAFRLGEFDSKDEADGYVLELAEDEVPAYVVTIRYDPGAPRYRVYGGAFETTAEAEVMRQMLEDAGLEAELVPRTGEPIA